MASAIEAAGSQMGKSVESTKENFSGIRTGRANPALLNGITVDYYGAPTPLKQMATIGVPEPRTLAVTPFDQSQAAAVEKAIRDSDLGVNPNRDGNVIRVTLPELTEDRRKDYVKLAKTKAEDGKVAIRNIRRKTKESVEAQVKDGALGEDEGDRLLKELDVTTKKFSDEIDSLLAAKEKEILEV
ncbi:MAG: ribosome recycling factor [Bifidobacteriaceae bacterium]|nr:ribosome recycling factor [Bifidobacteriaceae bacterium]